MFTSIAGIAAFAVSVVLTAQWIDSDRVDTSPVQRGVGTVAFVATIVTNIYTTSTYIQHQLVVLNDATSRYDHLPHLPGFLSP